MVRAATGKTPSKSGSHHNGKTDIFKSGIVILIFVVGMLGYYYYLSNRASKVTEENVRLTVAQELINRSPRWCLWLGECSPNELRKMPYCMKRIEAVREFRLSSKRASTNKLADIPTRFQTENMPRGHFIVIPEVSSEKRKYVPIGYMDDTALCSNKVRIMPDATFYHFGILTSNVHMAWMRVVCGRLKSDYDYSIKIVYNNFPWPAPTDEQRTKIEQTAQAVLDARNLYPDCSLADLYDEATMPPELRKAHQQNDKAVMQAYGFWGKLNTESACVAELMKMYQKLAEG